MLGTWIWGFLYGKKAPQNPWGAATLEWTHASSPPDPHNFHHTPLVTRGPYDFHLADDVFGPSGGDGHSGDGHGGDGASVGGDGASGDGMGAAPVPSVEARRI